MRKKIPMRLYEAIIKQKKNKKATVLSAVIKKIKFCSRFIVFISAYTRALTYLYITYIYI